MPFSWTDNEVALRHRGVTLHHLHRNDDGDDVLLSYHYGTAPDSTVGNGCGTSFDIRDFDPARGGDAAAHPELLRAAIDDLFAKGKESFLFPYLQSDEIPVPDDQPGPGPLVKSVIVLWSRRPDEGAAAVATIRAAHPEAPACRVSTETLDHPAADPDWNETCDAAFAPGPG